MGKMAAVAVCGLMQGIRAIAQELDIPEPVRAQSRLDQLVPQIEPYLDLYNPHTLRDRLQTGYD